MSAVTDDRDLEQRIADLEQQVRVLADAVRALARGLEPHPTEGLRPDAAGAAGRQAHEVLLAGGL